MRIVSGEFKSRVLKTLKGNNTRPTSDKIRGAIFDSIAFEGNYHSFLDLFSGSGAMGLEAISRGYDYSIFNDNNRDAVNIIKANIKDLGVSQQAKVFSFDYKKLIKSLNEKVDLIFIDPPYDKFDLSSLLSMISEYDLVNDDGIIIIEGSNQTKLETKIGNFSLFKEKTYKSTTILYYRKD